MQILTPTGYRDASTLTAGDEVCAFDADTGAPIINHIEAVQPVDYVEWCRWWQVEEIVPAFAWYRVNGTYLLFGEQSIWRNGTNVCHAKHLTVGDEIYDDADQPITIASIETVTDESLTWYRFDIDGDHSYIVDGLTVHNASRYWVGGTGTWDSSTTTNWAASSNGTGGQSVPGAADTVTFDGNSGGGTVTLNFGGIISIQSIALGSFTGTFDNSVNNNNFTISASIGFSASGSGTRNIKLGTATYTLTHASANWNFSTTSNLTFDGASANITFTGGTGQPNLNSGGLSQGHVTLGASTGAGFYSLVGSGTYASFDVVAPNYISVGAGTFTVTAAVNWAGNSTSQITIESGSPSSVRTLALAAGSIASWCAFRSITVTGSTLIATNSFDLGNNSGVTITSPGGGSFGVIGS